MTKFSWQSTTKFFGHVVGNVSHVSPHSVFGDAQRHDQMTLKRIRIDGVTKIRSTRGTRKGTKTPFEGLWLEQKT
jgi:hypothetical protein